MRTPLLLVPGMLCDASVWSRQIEALEDIADCRVADATRDATMADLARRILHEAPFDRFALAGFSLGGYAALEIVRAAPERVTGLALLATSARTDTPERSDERRRFIELAERDSGFAPITRAMLASLVAPGRLADRALSRKIVEMARRVGAEAYVRQQRAILSRRDGLAVLPGIRCPSLVLCGRQDERTPYEANAEIAAGIPGARFEVVEDCGHMVTLEAPDAVSAAMRAWLAHVR
ncbi:MAG: alpha/beta fold hydrolase [Betaproteobacteria bacterium]|nr:alpha/beta fold hydrolase [Betaproteobacteria bacterium]